MKWDCLFSWRRRLYGPETSLNYLANDMVSHPTRSVVFYHANLQTTYTVQKIGDITFILSIYIFSDYVVKNKHLFITNNQIHNLQTRAKNNLHPPTAHLTKFQKGVYYSGIKIFNNLPREIKDLTNKPIWFRNTLRRFLLINNFYNSEEYFNCKWLL